MKKRFRWGLALTLLCVFMLQMTVAAAGGTVTIAGCVISGNNVVVTATGATAQSDDGNYYLFALEPYQTGIGSRTDYCAAAPAAATVQFTTPLNYNAANSKLYSRFVVAVKSGAAYVAVSNEMYITNPEAVAAKAGGQPAKSKKGLITDAAYVADLTDLNVGYAAYKMVAGMFFDGGGVSYNYNGKTYNFNAGTVAAYDLLIPQLSNAGCNVIMVMMNEWNAAALDLIPPAGRVAGQTSYAFNVQEQVPTEKLEALMAFLSERYTNNGHGTVNTWIIGNEVNNNTPAHYMGNVSVEAFAADYAKQFRVCYNAIKSHNADAAIYTNIDQRWNFVDSARIYQYPGRSFLDNFATNISATGNIDWGLSFHPAAIPYDNAKFWSIPSPYSGMNLVNNSDSSKFVTVQNMQVIVNHMTQASMLSPKGTVRNMIVSELGFPSTNPTYATDEKVQAAAIVYAYKKIDSLPAIKAFVFHRHTDDAGEVATGLSYGLRSGARTKFSYEVFKYMDTGNTAYTDFALPYIGASSWASLGLK